MLFRSRIAIGSTEIRSADWSVVTTSGRVTFVADKTYTITSITQAAAAVITIGAHTLVIGQSVQVSAVIGMSQINALRGLITAVTGTTITVAINTTLFSAYASSGVVHTRPQTGETVTAGFEFDFPVRFNTSMPIGQDFPGHRSVDGVELVEILNP